ILAPRRLRIRAQGLRKQGSTRSEERAYVRTRTCQRVQQAVVVLQQVGARLRKDAEDGALLDLQVLAPERELIAPVLERGESSATTNRFQADARELLQDGLDPAGRIAGERVQLVGQLVRIGEALLVEHQAK